MIMKKLQSPRSQQVPLFSNIFTIQLPYHQKLRDVSSYREFSAGESAALTGRVSMAFPTKFLSWQ